MIEKITRSDGLHSPMNDSDAVCDTSRSADISGQDVENDRGLIVAGTRRRLLGIFGIVLVPTAMNFAILLISVHVAPVFSQAVWSAFVIGALSFLISLCSFIAYYDDDISASWAWASITTNGLIVIVVFASIHKGAGIIYAGPMDTPGVVALDWATAIYFSTVTFTTLGYGDFQPVATLRLVAAGEALLGYLFLGLLVGAALQTVSRARGGDTVGSVSKHQVKAHRDADQTRQIGQDCQNQNS